MQNHFFTSSQVRIDRTLEPQVAKLRTPMDPMNPMQSILEALIQKL